MTATVAIRPPEPGDRAAWLGLWHGCLAFYGAAVPAATTETTWSRLIDPAVPVHGLLAFAAADGRALGLINDVLHLSTWDPRPACYLNDLFVLPEARGAGVGRALIAALTDRARAADWFRIYLMTAESNATAQALYRRVGTLTAWRRDDLPVAKA